MNKRWMVMLAGVALATVASAAPRVAQAPVHVDDAQVVPAKAKKKKKVVRKATTTTTRHTHTESHSSASSSRSKADK